MGDRLPLRREVAGTGPIIQLATEAAGGGGANLLRVVPEPSLEPEAEALAGVHAPFHTLAFDIVKRQERFDRPSGGPSLPQELLQLGVDERVIDDQLDLSHARVLRMRCTKRVLERFELSPDPTPCSPTTLLVDWYANRTRPTRRVLT